MKPTYKSEQVPRYHARETAIQRAADGGSRRGPGIVRRPSLEAMYRARKGEYVLYDNDRIVPEMQQHGTGVYCRYAGRTEEREPFDPEREAAEV